MLLALLVVAALVPVALLLVRRGPPPEPVARQPLPPKPRTIDQVLEAIEPVAGAKVQAMLRDAGFDGAPDRLTFVAIKSERTFEVWGRKDGAEQLIATYPFTAFSGSLGPKLREGDLQIPEGTYAFEYLNPNSSYHLSVKLDYPNAFDRRMAAVDGRERSNLGSDIMLHGKAVTIGCIPLGDEAMEEIFFLLTTVGLDRSGIIITPVDFREGQMRPAGLGPDWLPKLDEQLREALQPFAER